jgi:hypothetical protein
MINATAGGTKAMGFMKVAFQMGESDGAIPIFGPLSNRRAKPYDALKVDEAKAGENENGPDPEGCGPFVGRVNEKRGVTSSRALPSR